MTGHRDSEEKRQFGRRQTYLHGWVIIPGRPKIACTIRNMSAGGALLEFMDAECLPFSFILTLEGVSQTLGCEVLHAYGTRFGVGFVEVASVPHGGRASYGGETGAWVETGSMLSRK
jgi:hypothetical protein